MAGGTWTSQNKVQPGVYINTRSRASISILHQSPRGGCPLAAVVWLPFVSR